MNANDFDPDGLSRAEQRLHQVLEPLRSDPPRAARSLIARTMRTARWQHVVRAPLQLVGHLAGAVADALRLLLGQGSAR